jgi:hypothetical protein
MPPPTQLVSDVVDVGLRISIFTRTGDVLVESMNVEMPSWNPYAYAEDVVE